MRFPFREIHDLVDAQRNFEEIEKQAIYTGAGAPTFKPVEGLGAFYFRKDTPGTVNQRLYVYNGSAWTGIL